MWLTLANPKNLGLRLVFEVVFCTHQLGPEPTIYPQSTS